MPSGWKQAWRSKTQAMNALCGTNGRGTTQMCIRDRKESLSKWGGKIPPNLKLPLRDGDIERPDDEAYAGSWFLNANSRQAPEVVDRKVQRILDQSEVYSGCYGQISVTFYGFNTNGNRGIAAGLGNIQKLRDGEPLGGKANAAEEFETYDDDDFLS